VIRIIVAGMPAAASLGLAVENIEADARSDKGPDQREGPIGGKSPVELTPTQDAENDDQGELHAHMGEPDVPVEVRRSLAANHPDLPHPGLARRRCRTTVPTPKFLGIQPLPRIRTAGRLH
jgi:hypothetical protein